jgi:hypothetical protein
VHAYTHIHNTQVCDQGNIKIDIFSLACYKEADTGVWSLVNYPVLSCIQLMNPCPASKQVWVIYYTVMDLAAA